MASTAEVDLLVDATRALPTLERDLNRIVRVAEDGAPEVDVTAALATVDSLTQIQRDLSRVINSTSATASDVDIAAVIDQEESVRRMRDQLTDLIRDVEDGTPDLFVDFLARTEVHDSIVDVRQGLREVVRAAQATAPDIDIDVDVDVDSADTDLRHVDETTRHLTRTILGALAPLGSFAGSLGTASLAAGALPGLLAGIVTSVESIAPAAAVGVSALLTLKLATGAVQLGMLGVADAVKDAFDPETKPEDLAKEIDKLAPAAQKFVLALAGMKGEFHALQIGVQQELFRGLDKSLQGLAKEALPPVRKGLTDAAKTLNDMGQGAAKAAADLAESGMLGQALKSSNRALRSLVDIPHQAVSAFGALAVAAGPSLERIATAVAGVADRASESLFRSFSSGGLEKAIDAAVDVVAQLGRVAKNVFGALGNIMKAATTNGGGLFDTLETITGALKKATGTKEFQAAIGALSDTMSKLATTAAPLLVQAIGVLGPVVTALAPPIQELIKSLGFELGQVIEQLGPVLESLAVAAGSLIVALLPFVGLAGDLAVAVLPALVPLFDALGQIIEESVPFFTQLATNLGDQLVPLLNSLTPILEDLLPPFVQLAQEVFPRLTEILIELSPLLLEMATEFADILVAIAPVIGQFLLFAAVGGGLMLEVIADVVIALIHLVEGGFKYVSYYVETYVLPSLKAVSDFLHGDFSGALQSALEVTSHVTGDAAALWGKFKDRTTALLTLFGVFVSAKIIDIMNTFNSTIAKKTLSALSYFQSLPGRIVSALGNPASLLYRVGQMLIQGLINGVTAMIPSLISKFASVTASIPDWKGPEELDRRILIPAGRAVMEGFTQGITDSVPALRSELAGITSALPGFLSAPVSADFGFRGLVAAAPPLVTVTIGNEVVDRYVTTRIETINRADSRVAAQGTRF